MPRLAVLEVIYGIVQACNYVKECAPIIVVAYICVPSTGENRGWLRENSEWNQRKVFRLILIHSLKQYIGFQKCEKALKGVSILGNLASLNLGITQKLQNLIKIIAFIMTATMRRSSFIIFILSLHYFRFCSSLSLSPVDDDWWPLIKTNFVLCTLLSVCYSNPYPYTVTTWMFTLIKRIHGSIPNWTRKKYTLCLVV
jgi:hypothetical protein